MDNKLSKVNPKLAKDWSEKNYPLTADDVTYASHKAVWWKCDKGHEWKAKVKSRTINKTGCPYCSHNKVLSGFNDLAFRFPEIASEWSERNSPLTPDKVTAFANRKVWWKCRTCGNEWNTLISTRSEGSKCPYCSGWILKEGFNDLATKFPSLSLEWSERNQNLSPNMINEKSRKNVWWKCSVCGYEYKAVINSRVKGLSCPACADRVVNTGFNDLATTHPHIAEEWDFDMNICLTPETISALSKKLVWWRCKSGHFWKAKVYERTVEDKNCCQCEADFGNVFAQLLIMYYAKVFGFSIDRNNKDITGMVIDIYIPELNLAIDITETNKESENRSKVNEYICKKQRINYSGILLGSDIRKQTFDIRKALQKCHIYIKSDSDEDIQILRNWFFSKRINKRV